MKELPISYTVGSPGQRQKLSGSPQIPLRLVIDHLTVVQRIMKSNKGTSALLAHLSSAYNEYLMI